MTLMLTSAMKVAETPRIAGRLLRIVLTTSIPHLEAAVLPGVCPKECFMETKSRRA